MSTEVRLNDRIKELSHDAGTSDFTLAGAPNGFSPFSDFYESGNVLYYAATDGIRYEVGSGEFIYDGATNILRRNPLRNNRIDAGPWYVNGASSSGPTEGQEGVFHPLYLTDAAARNKRGYTGDKPTDVSLFTFSGHPGVTFYLPNNHSGIDKHGVHAATSGANYASSGAKVTFAGITEVYVTYPGKYSVFSAFGTSGCQEPRLGGIPIWGSEQVLDYDKNLTWDFEREALGISLSGAGRGPVYAIDIGGSRAYSQVRASGFIGGGSGIFFSGGQALPQNAAKTASGGTQLEPFYRNELDDSSGADDVFLLTGRVQQRFHLKSQAEGTVLSGPAKSSCGGSCADAPPTFRLLTLNDIPDLSSLYVKEQTDEAAGGYIAGAVPFKKASGIIEYDKDFVFLNASKRLGVNTRTPNATLDVFGDMMVSGDATISGNLNVRGDITYVDSTNVAVRDKQLELASLSGNATYDQVDSAIDDGGIVVRSSGDPEAHATFDTGDKKWTWRRSTNTWTAQTANGDYGNPLLGINVSGIIFGDQTSISGAYQAGSGLSLHNNIELNVGKLFNVSGMNYDPNVCSTSGQITPGYSITVSGRLGLDTTVSGVFVDGHAGKYAPSAVIMFDPSGLSGTLMHSIQTGGSYSHWTISDGSTSENIANTNTVTFGNAGGVDVSYNAGANTVTTNTTTLSGTLMKGALIQDVIQSGQMYYEINYSGDKLKQLIDAAGGGYANWNLVALGGGTKDGSWSNASEYDQDVLTTEKLYVSGYKGMVTMEVHPYSTSGLLVTDPSNLSGTLYNTILYSGDKVVQQIQTGALAGSGITKELTGDGYVLNLDTHGSGYLRNLMFETPHPSLGNGAPKVRSIRIGVEAGGSGTRNDDYRDGGMGPETIAIGTFAGYQALNCSGTLFMGSGAGQGASGVHDSIIIGKTAGVSASGSHPDDLTTNLILIGSRAGNGINLETNSLIAIGRDAAYGSSGNNSSAIMGHNAGKNSFNFRNSVAIGKDAGLQASGSDYSVMIGHQAGENAWVCDKSVFIGDRAGDGASGIDNSVFIGERAGLDASGAYPTGVNDLPKLSDVVAIGSQAAYQAREIEETVAIGKYAGFQTMATLNGRLNLIGLSVGRYASGIDYISAIGTNAAEELRNSEYSNLIGNYAGHDASGIDRVFAVGQLAADRAQTMTYTNVIGTQAGAQATGISYSNAMGHNTLLTATGVAHGSFMGSYAGTLSSGTNYAISMGYQAGYYHHNANRNIQIGREAGYNSALGDDNVYIGYKAGRERLGSDGIIIGNFNDKDISWADNDTDGIVAIGSLICGIDDGTAVKKLRLGKTASSESTFTNICTSIRSASSTDTVLKLFPQGTSQVAPQLETRAIDASDSSFYNNTIVNATGNLQLPVATGRQGSSTPEAWILNGGDVLKPADGVVVIVATGLPYQLRFYYNGAWHNAS